MTPASVLPDPALNDHAAPDPDASSTPAEATGDERVDASAEVSADSTADDTAEASETVASDDAVAADSVFDEAIGESTVAEEPVAEIPPTVVVPDRADAPVSETVERFIRAIAAVVPVDRIEELHLFSALKQGGVETGIAVIAARADRPTPVLDPIPELALGDAPPPVAEPVAEPVDATESAAASTELAADASSATDADADADVDDVVEAELLPDSDADVIAMGPESEEEPEDAEIIDASDTDAPIVEAELVATEADDAEAEDAEMVDADASGVVDVEAEAAAAVHEDEDSPYAPDVIHDIVEHAIEDTAEIISEVVASEQAVAAPIERHTVYTARYRLVQKGPERGKWETDIRDEADAPLITVEMVVRGVQRRAGEASETTRYSGAQVARILERGKR